MNFQDYLKFIIIFVSLIALLLVSMQYMRHRLNSKYRDLMIIFLLLITFLLGTQYLSYTQHKAYADSTSRMVGFLNSLAENQRVSQQAILVNSLSLSNGMIVRVRDNYYEVHFNSDFSAYTLSEINLVNPTIQIVDQGDQ